MSDNKKIIHFWKNIEQYMLPSVDSKYEKSIFERNADNSLDAITTYIDIKQRRITFPWNDQNFQNFMLDDKEYTWEHSLYMGGLEINEIYQKLTNKKVYGAAKTTVYAAFNVDEEGRLYVQKPMRASFADDFIKRVNPQEKIMPQSIFQEEIMALRQKDQVEAYRQSILSNIQALKKSLTGILSNDDFIQKEIDKNEVLFRRLAHTTNILQPNEYIDLYYKIKHDLEKLGLSIVWDIKVVSTPVPYEFSNTPNNLILSSFYNDHLEEARGVFERGDDVRTPLIHDYLSLNQKQIDVNSEEYQSQKYNKPACSLKGMNEMQLELNNALFYNAQHPLFSNIISVNGPPGTGKTTSIQNGISHMIYMQTKLLSNEKIFNDQLMTYSNIHKMLGVLVLSSNNEAVSNVMNGFSMSDLTYFPTVAKLQESTNLVAQSFGKRSNVNKWLRLLSDKNKVGFSNSQMPIIYANDYEGFLEYNQYLMLDPSFKGETLSNYFNRVSSIDQSSIHTYLNTKLMEFKTKNPDDDGVLQLCLDIRAALISLMHARYHEFITAMHVHGDVVTPTAENIHLFFLLHPVASSTLASCGNILNKTTYDYGTFPLVFIDEAAQTPPQHLIKPLLYARRMMVCGDPMQTEKINGSTNEIMNIFIKEMSLEDKSIGRYLGWFHPANFSAQHLADRVATLGYAEEGSRIGFPLIEHYRCHDEIFKFVNHYAYNGRLVQKTDSKKRLPMIYAKGSTWIDTDLSTPVKTNSRIQKSEFDVIEEIIEHMGKNNHLFKNQTIFLMTMFNDIKTELYYRFYSKIKFLKKMGINIHIDTIHGFQGKECDRGYFILGGKNLDDRFGSFLNTPNVLNVAISRCRHYLYVIGHREFARHHRSLGILARSIDHIPACTIKSNFIGDNYGASIRFNNSDSPSIS